MGSLIVLSSYCTKYLSFSYELVISLSTNRKKVDSNQMLDTSWCSFYCEFLKKKIGLCS